MQAVDVLRRFIEKYSFGLRDGSVYMKAPEASLTHIFCCSVRKFVLNILGNAEIADQIATFVNPLCNLLEEPSCRQEHLSNTHIVQTMFQNERHSLQVF